jgi:energy-coupling factor transport system ATP-binding protein
VPKQIEIRNLSYRLASLPPERSDILRGISLSVEKGSFIAIVGANGSGKTTLIKHINGLDTPTKGNVIVEGLNTKDPQNGKKLRALVGMVFQEPSHQIVASTVEEDVAFGLENLNLPTRNIQSIVKQQLISAELTEEATRPPHLLSGGQIQRLALAGVLARQPSIILFDEPTSMLDPISRKRFLSTVLDLKNQGITILLVTHHMDEAVQADRVIVMSRGQIIEEGSPAEIFTDNDKLYEIGLELPRITKFIQGFRQIGWKMSGNLVDPDDLISKLPIFDGRVNNYPSDKLPEQREEIISFQDVHYTYLAGTPLARHALRGVNLNTSSEVIHGIAGGNGSGKSTLLQHINGILRPSTGRIQVNDYHIENPSTPLREIIRLVGLVFQNPETQFFEVFVGDEIAYGPKQFGMNDVRERVRSSMDLVNLDFDSFKDRRLATLSGGEKRKVALASTLILNQGILLFDEPTAGMDPVSKAEILKLFTSLRDEGKTIVIASHRMDELAEVADDLSIMHGGKVMRTGNSQDIFLNTKSLLQAGLEAPLAVQLSQALIEKGWPLNRINTTTAGRLFRAIQEVTQ